MLKKKLEKVAQMVGIKKDLEGVLKKENMIVNGSL